MADFCTQCSLEHFGEDFDDLAGLCAYGECVWALCEGCGSCMVDHHGVCVSETCLKAHGVAAPLPGRGQEGIE